VQPELEQSFVAFASNRLAALTQAAFLLTGDRHRAEDLVQTALARSYAAWHRIERADPEAYVRRVLLNAYRSECRRRPWREMPSESIADQADAMHATSDHAVVQADRDLVWRALTRLSPQQRAVVVLRYYEDRGDAEIAELRALSSAGELPVRWPVVPEVVR
jgi:RNA polymerase sigma-70 factor (sigma-E family)